MNLEYFDLTKENLIAQINELQNLEKLSDNECILFLTITKEEFKSVKLSIEELYSQYSKLIKKGDWFFELLKIKQPELYEKSNSIQDYLSREFLNYRCVNKLEVEECSEKIGLSTDDYLSLEYGDLKYNVNEYLSCYENLIEEKSID